MSGDTVLSVIQCRLTDCTAPMASDSSPSLRTRAGEGSRTCALARKRGGHGHLQRGHRLPHCGEPNSVGDAIHLCIDFWCSFSTAPRFCGALCTLKSCAEDRITRTLGSASPITQISQPVKSSEESFVASSKLDAGEGPPNRLQTSESTEQKKPAPPAPLLAALEPSRQVGSQFSAGQFSPRPRDRCGP